jgi:hypothetical protein
MFPTLRSLKHVFGLSAYVSTLFTTITSELIDVFKTSSKPSRLVFSRSMPHHSTYSQHTLPGLYIKNGMPPFTSAPHHPNIPPLSSTKRSRVTCQQAKIVLWQNHYRHVASPSTYQLSTRLLTKPHGKPDYSTLAPILARRMWKRTFVALVQ